LSPLCLMEVHQNAGVQQTALEWYKNGLLAKTLLAAATGCHEKYIRDQQQDNPQQVRRLQPRTPPPPVFIKPQFTITGNAISMVWMMSSGVNPEGGYVVRMNNGQTASMEDVYVGHEKSCSKNGLRPATAYTISVHSVAGDGTIGRGNPTEVATLDEPDAYMFKLDKAFKHGAIMLSADFLQLSGRGNESEGVVLGDIPIDMEGVTYWEVHIDSFNSKEGNTFDLGVACRCPDLAKWYYNSPEGWALQLSGKGCVVKHNGRAKKKDFGPPVKTGSLIGLYLDMDAGSLHMFQDKKYVGEAFTSALKGKELYPAFHQAAGLECTVRAVPNDEYPEIPET